MEYLAYIDPKSLTEKQALGDVGAGEGVGLHMTLCYFFMDPVLSKPLIADLSSISFLPFYMKAQSIEHFDKGHTVLEFSCPAGLQRLHEDIVDAVRTYADADLEKTISKYYLGNFRPHVTISKQGQTSYEDIGALVGHEEYVDSFSLVRKVDEEWQKWLDFYGSQSLEHSCERFK